MRGAPLGQALAGALRICTIAEWMLGGQQQDQHAATSALSWQNLSRTLDVAPLPKARSGALEWHLTGAAARAQVPEPAQLVRGPPQWARQR